MGIESKPIRRLLASSVFSSLQKAGSGQGPVEEPPSYSGSFNPFPALVIGVTGAAMAAHFQPYLFGVRLFSQGNNMLTIGQGANSLTMGKFTCCFLCIKMFHLFLSLARTTTVRSPIPSAHRSVGKLLLGLWWPSFHVLDGGSDNCRNASRSRWYVVEYLWLLAF